MVKLTTQELEEIVSQVENPVDRVKFGLRTAVQTRNQEQLSQYSRQYLEAVIEGSIEDQKDSYWDRDDEGSVTARTLLGRLPKGEAKELAVKYVNQRLTGIDKPSRENDEDVGRLSELAETYDILEETKNGAVAYVNRRLELAQNPNSAEDIEIGNIRGTCDKYGITNEEAKRIASAKEILSPSPFRENKKELSDEELKDTMGYTWELAKKLRNNSGNPNGLRGLIGNEQFQQLYSSDDKARALATEVIGEDLKSGWGDKFEWAMKIRDAYGITNLDTEARGAVCHNLMNGQFERVDNLGAEFGYHPTEQDFEDAKSHYREQLDESIKKGDVRQSIDSRRRLKSLDMYMQNGLNVEDIPEVAMPDNYSGKIIIADIKGRKVLRGDMRGRSDMHKDIEEQLQDDVRMRGFTSYVSVEGGAYLSQNKDGSIKISGDSGDFGECDKDLAKQLVSNYFPDREVIAESSRGNGW